jgi:hypothetical protein
MGEMVVANNLLSLGQAIDALGEEKNSVAISIAPIDEGTILMHDEEDWLMIKYPHKEYFTYNINIQKNKKCIKKRWIIVDRPEHLNEYKVKDTDNIIYNDSFEEEGE